MGYREKIEKRNERKIRKNNEKRDDQLLQLRKSNVLFFSTFLNRLQSHNLSYGNFHTKCQPLT